MKATYTNNQTKETCEIGGVSNLEKAWNLSKFVCSQMNWNHEMFAYDVTVKLA